jgi:GNAT superfamily N-acetyltransferase
MIRTITPDDAAMFLDLQRQLDFETKYMSFQEGERKVSEKEQRERLRRVLNQESSTILVADTGEGDLAGYCAAYGGKQARNRHRVGITVAVLERFHRRGIATRLITRLEYWARITHIHRLELTTLEINYPALCFYLAHQFHVEGRRKSSVYMKEHGYLDELHMGKLL